MKVFNICIKSGSNQTDSRLLVSGNRCQVTFGDYFLSRNGKEVSHCHLHVEPDGAFPRSHEPASLTGFW